MLTTDHCTLVTNFLNPTVSKKVSYFKLNVAALIAVIPSQPKIAYALQRKIKVEQLFDIISRCAQKITSLYQKTWQKLEKKLLYFFVCKVYLWFIFIVQFQFFFCETHLIGNFFEFLRERYFNKRYQQS